MKRWPAGASPLPRSREGARSSSDAARTADSSVLGTEEGDRADGCIPTPLERRCGRSRHKFDSPPTVAPLPVDQPAPLFRDHCLGEQPPCRAVGPEREVERSDRLAFCTPLDSNDAVGRQVLAEPVEQPGRGRLFLGDSVEEADREEQLVGVWRGVETVDGGEAPLRRNRWPATSAWWRPTRWALAATCVVIWSDDTGVLGSTHNGALPARSALGRANGSPPSGKLMAASQSHNSTARGVVVGATSASTSKACMAPAGWLSGDRRSGSRPQP